jgi:branched-chain amino acid transport system permease protein
VNTGLGDRVNRTGLAWTGGVLALLAAVLLPVVDPDPYLIGVGTQALVYVGLALGLNMVVGYAGLLDLGYAAFFAIGAYGSSILTTTYHWPIGAAVPAVMLMAILSGLIIGGPTLRLRSDYLAIVTLGFGEIIQTTANNLQITGGATGIFDIPPLSAFGVSLYQPVDYYYLLVGLCVVYLAITWRIRRSKIGRAWLAIREDEDAALAMGINTVRYKLFAYIGGAVFASLIGLVYGAFMTAITPTSFGYEQSVLIIVAVLIGGMGSIPGMVIGGILVEVIPEAMRDFSDLRLLLFGIIMVIVMIFRPAGVWPERPLTWARRTSRAAPVASEGVDG